MRVLEKEKRVGYVGASQNVLAMCKGFRIAFCFLPSFVDVVLVIVCLAVGTRNCVNVSNTKTYKE